MPTASTTAIVQNAREVSLPHISIINGARPKVTSTELASKSTALAKPTDLPAVLLVGLDDQGRPHASWFDEAQADAVALAADMMGFAIIDVSNDELAAIANTLPKGKLFESGKAFVPFVKRTTYDVLTQHLDGDYLTAAAARVEAAKAAASQEYAKASKGEVPPRLPEDWSKLMVGDQVLATDDPTDGWYTAEILAVEADDRFRLRWSDYPDLAEFTRSLTDIALLHPQCTTR